MKIDIKKKILSLLLIFMTVVTMMPATTFESMADITTPALEESTLFFTALEAGTKVKLEKAGSPDAISLEYSSNGANWIDYEVDSEISLPAAGDKVYFRSKSEETKALATNPNNYHHFSVTSGSVSASGNATALLNKNGTNTIPNNGLTSLFRSCAGLKSISGGLLPATELGTYCYASMFRECTGLTGLPEGLLPATAGNLACYDCMFMGCTGLTIDKIPNSLFVFKGKLITWCYNSMFANCTGIKLSETPKDGYTIRFRIPVSGEATNGNNGSVDNMFTGTGGTWTGSPGLCQTYYGYKEGSGDYSSPLCFKTLEEGSLDVSIKKVGNPGDINLEYSYDCKIWEDFTLNMGVSTNSEVGCTLYFRTKSDEDQTFSKSSSDYYYFEFGNNTPDFGVSGDVTTLLNVKGTNTLSDYCFSHLFDGATKLKSISADFLPASNLADGCYEYMFQGCTGLRMIKVPNSLFHVMGVLPDYCYRYMFAGCSNIDLGETKTGNYTIPFRIPVSGDADYGNNSIQNMFYGTKGIPVSYLNTTYYGYREPEPEPKALSITALEANTQIKLVAEGSISGRSFEYMTDAIEWTSYTIGDTITLTSAGDKAYFRSANEETMSLANTLNNYHNFVVSSGSISVSGDATTLLNKNGTNTIPNYGLFNLFAGVTGLKSISGGLLPATTLGSDCYASMFRNCTGLTEIPEGLLPATTGKTECYQAMFYGCKGLTIEGIPNSLFIFTGTLPERCYGNMFTNCTGVKLSETQTGKYTIPFIIPVSGSATSGNDSLQQMFYGTGGTFTSTPTTNKTYYGYKESENTAEPLCFTAIKAKADITLSKKGNMNDIPFEYSTDGTSWEPYTLGSKIVMSAVGDKVYFRSTSTETKPLAKSDDIRYNFSTTGLLESIIVSGDATTMLNKNGTDTIPDYGLTGLFRGCSGLKSISPGLLPATKLGKYCYKRMFYYCTNLREIPEGLLPATTPKEGCYESMFEFCPMLTVDKIPPSLFIFQGTLPNRTYASMFKDCTRIMLSETPGNEYSIPFRFPADGTASNTNALNDMFTGTDGTFTGSPSLNTTYYGYKDEPEVPGDSTIKNELCLTALEANTTLALYKTGEPEVLTFKYLVNDGVWTDYTIGEPINLANPGDKVYFKSTTGVNRAIATATSDYYSFYVDSGSISASGDATTMLNKNGTDHIPTSGLAGLFRNCTRLKSISGGLLPATKLGESAYNRMFYRCGITEIPGNLLPATTSVTNCYYEMFAKCTGLTIDKVPNSLFIFNGTLAYQAYANMFNGCSGIKLSETSGDGYTIPFRIPETGDLGNQAYGPIDMFKDTGGTWKGTPTLGKTYYGYKEPVEAAEPLCFTALEANTKVNFKKTGSADAISLEYSTNGTSWLPYTIDNEITLASKGDKLYFRSTSTETKALGNNLDDHYNYHQFAVNSGSISASGDATTLLNKNGTDTVPDYGLFALFSSCKGGLKSISPGLLPATKLGRAAYDSMFAFCSALESIPAGLLPATELGEKCYDTMFRGCTSVKSIPEGLLPATTMAKECYSAMFNYCSGIESIPQGLLPATTLAQECYSYMFKSCTGLKSLPGDLLPATTLAEGCYSYMFQYCTGLTIEGIPNSLFHVTGTLPPICYYNMFNNCTGIKLSTEQTDDYTIPFRVPVNGNATDGSGHSVDNMFSSTGGTFTGSPALNTTYYGYKAGVSNELCFTALEDNTKIKLVTSKYNPVTLEYLTSGGSWSNYTENIEITLASAGDKLYFRNTEETDQSFMTCKFEINSGAAGVSGDATTLINKNGTDTLPEGCFASLFEDCTRLKTISEGLLPATNLASSCYSDMFSGCTGLTEIPEGLLPATILTERCYSNMFAGCAGLTEIPEGFLPATTLAADCYYNMFYFCNGLTIEGIPNSLFHVTGQLPDECYKQMFAGCEGIKLSEKKSGNYSIPFRIPVSGKATAGEDSLKAMFAESGADFGTPDVNTIYYGYDPNYVPPKLTMKVLGHSLTIGADLAVNFYFEMPEELIDGKMIFTIDHNGGTQVVDGVKTEKDGILFTCKINVNQMNDAITWEYKIGDQVARSLDQEKQKKYSFYTYLNSATNAANTASAPANAAFCEKLKAYGYYAQHYLAESKGNPIKPYHAELVKPTKEPTSHTEDLKKFELEATGSSTNISGDGITRSLVLDSMISMKFYIPLKESCEWTDATLPEITVKRDNSNLGVLDAKIDENGQLCITTAGIAIKFLERMLTVQIGDEFTIKTSAMSYARELSKLDSTNAKKLADALYELCENANGK